MLIFIVQYDRPMQKTTKCNDEIDRKKSRANQEAGMKRIVRKERHLEVYVTHNLHN